MKCVFSCYFIKDFWYRFEFQQRGSVHVHGILWCDDAPDVRLLSKDGVNDPMLVQRIEQYFDTHISCMNPTKDIYGNVERTVGVERHPSSIPLTADTNLESDYCDLVLTLECHTCKEGSCYPVRPSGCTRVPECKSKYPKPLSLVTKLVYEPLKLKKNSKSTDDDLSKKSGVCSDKPVEESRYVYKMIMRRNDTQVVPHNKAFLQTFRSNCDFQPVVDVWQLVNYIAKYAS